MCDVLWQLAIEVKLVMGENNRVLAMTVTCLTQARVIQGSKGHYQPWTQNLMFR